MTEELKGPKISEPRAILGHHTNEPGMRWNLNDMLDHYF